MATNVQRSGLGFEKFFRRRSSSPEPPKDSEKNPNNIDDDESGPSKIGKLFGQKSAEDKNEPPNDVKNISAKDKAELSSQKTDGSNKSLKKKKTGASTKKDDKKHEDTEACKELIIKDDVGQVRLAEIINNSIKEAVLNIVKEGVCPLADSFDRTKDSSKKAPSSIVDQEAQDKENKPGSPKHLDSLLSGANKTFDSHLCRSEYHPSNASHSPYKSTDNERVNFNQFNRELCPHVGKDRKAKSSKQKDKNLQQASSPKVSRQVKGSSHFRTDNRRMTGNVNIYICSEANENAKDKKQKDECKDESETTSETKTCTSSLSVSTSKLVAALRKKQRKNQEDEPLKCLCDIPESSAKLYRSDSRIGEDEDDGSCVIDDGSGDARFFGTQSSSSRDCVCGDEKFSELDFLADSDLGSSDRACTSQDCKRLTGSASDQYISYDNNDCWRRTCENYPSYDDEDCGSYKMEKESKREQSNSDEKLDERCSCCNLKRCQKERPKIMTYRRQEQDRGDRKQLNRCPCIVEEEDEDCCNDRKDPKETFTVCGNSEEKEKSSSDDKLKSKSVKTASGSGSGILKGKEQPGSPKSGKILQIDSATSQKLISDNKDEANVKDTEVARTGDVLKSDDNEPEPLVVDGKQKSSFFYRSIKKVMGVVSTRKDEDTSAAEGNKKNRESSPDGAAKLKSNGKNGTDNIDKESVGPTEKEKTPSGPSSSPGKRSRSRITTAIASRRSSATTNDSSNLSIPQSNNKAKNSGSPTKLSPSRSIQKFENLKQDTTKSESQKVSENCDCCCAKSEPPKMNPECCRCHTKCRKVSSSLSVPCKKVEPLNTKICSCCPKCGYPMEFCNCCKRKTQPIVEKKSCKCCPKCRRPIADCKCRKCVKAKRSEQNKCRQPSDFEDVNNNRRCLICCNPGAECNCNKICPAREDRCLKSMICIYCDNPQDSCTCKAPVRKCSQCGLPLDVCNCKTPEGCDCNGRLIAPAEGQQNEQTICVTAWKPRRSIRKYFARETNDEDFYDDCPCFDKSKPYGSDGLPYQKRQVFSTVMTELQQKISGSVCCNVCRKVPCCCCCVKNTDREQGEKSIKKPRLSTITEKRIPCPSQERSRCKSPAESCKCPSISSKKRGKKVAATICDRCNTSPCRCRRSSGSPQNKPQAKCYYCKNSPCTCEPVIEPAGNTRQFRSADSSHRRRMQRGSIEKKSKENNGYRGHVVVPYAGNQKITKYCYKENAAKHSLHPGERVR